MTNLSSNQVDLSEEEHHLAAAMTRQSIEFCIKGFIIALILTFIWWFFRVIQMMGFFV